MKTSQTLSFSATTPRQSHGDFFISQNRCGYELDDRVFVRDGCDGSIEGFSTIYDKFGHKKRVKKG